jgi:superfamily II DNA or RNA helicase
MLTIPQPQRFTLRPYQEEQKADIYKSIRNGVKRILCQLSTGGGKTVLFSNIANDCAKKEKRTLVMVHRKELMDQAARSIEQSTGIRPGIVKAGMPFRPDRAIQVASIQTLHSRKDQYNSKFFDFGLVVIDECHRSTARTYQEVLDMCPNPTLLGFTATPVRTDGKGLGDVYQEIVTGIPTKELIELGALSNYKFFEAGQSAGDPLHPKNIVRNYEVHAAGKQCIAFCQNTAHSIECAVAYNQAGHVAAHLDCGTPEKVRDQILKDFAEKKIQILLNYGLFIEGLDIVGIEAVQVARNVGSIANFLQMLGRGLRPFEGKDHAIFLMHSDAHNIHGHPADPRVWTLDGVEKRKPSQKNPIEEEEKLIEPPPEPVSQLFLESLLQEVSGDRDESIGYIAEIRRLIQYYDKMNKSPGWIYDLVIKLRPTPVGWHYYAEACGMPRKWADKVIEGLEKGVVYQVPPPKVKTKKTENNYTRNK